MTGILNEMKQKLLLILTALFLLGTVLCGYRLISTYTALSADMHQIEEAKETKKEGKQIQNDDVIGWISIKGTNIDYPVMWTPDNPEYYLHRNLKGEYSYPGLPFLDYRCDLSSDNLVIYGHNMLNKTMFSQLLQFEKADFREKHRRIRLETGNEVRTYTVIAVIKTDITGFRCDSMINAADEAEYNEFLEEIQENSLYFSGKEGSGQLISLSTCSYHTENGRFVVIGKLVENN